MSNITYAEICDAVESTLGAATGVTYSQSYNELTEGMQDSPTLQVYPQSDAQDPTGNTDRTTFQAGRRQSDIVIHADLLARPRRHIGEDMAALLPLADAIKDVLEAQDAAPYFGLEGLQAFSWTSSRVEFNYAEQAYVGWRYIINFRVF